jgi:hypothetical protein
MDFIDYTWDQIEGAFVKENILGSGFHFRLKRIWTFPLIIFLKSSWEKFSRKEQLDILKNGAVATASVEDLNWSHWWIWDYRSVETEEQVLLK